MARSAFLEQSDSAEEVAKSLGISALGRFFRLGLPLARPAVFAGIALVMMETASDFGAVDFFAVQTLTTGIFSVWLESNNGRRCCPNCINCIDYNCTFGFSLKNLTNENCAFIIYRTVIKI